MTTSVMSQRDVKVGLLYSCLNEFTTFFTMIIKRFDIWSLNFRCGCAMDVKLSMKIGDDDVIDDIIMS